MDSAITANPTANQNSSTFTPAYCETSTATELTTVQLPKGARGECLHHGLGASLAANQSNFPSTKAGDRSDFFINGVWNKLCDALKSAFDLSKRNGNDVTLIHNETATEGKRSWFGEKLGQVRDLANAFGGLIGAKSGANSSLLCECRRIRSSIR